MKSHKPAVQKNLPSKKERLSRDGRTRRPMQRIYQIHSSIRSGSLPNCSTLARELDVDRKTVQRDITFMRDELGLPLVYCDDLHGYRYDEDISDFPVFELSEEELATLFFARTALQGIRGTRLAETLAVAFSKVTRGMLGSVQLNWADLDTAFSRKEIKQDTRLIKPFGQIAKAILDRLETTFYYRKLGGEQAERRRVQPLHLGEVEGGC